MPGCCQVSLNPRKCRHDPSAGAVTSLDLRSQRRAGPGRPLERGRPLPPWASSTRSSGWRSAARCKGLQIDERTLTLIDSDGDGHVRPPEVIAAVSWACARLRDPSLLLRGRPIPLEASGPWPEGARSPRPRAGSSRGWARPRARHGRAGRRGGQGRSRWAPQGRRRPRPEAAPDEATRALIGEVAQCCGKATEETVAAFFADLAAFKAWSEAGGSTGSADLGPAAAEAFAAVAAVRSKVADYFARTQLAAFDPRPSPA
jgi:hypothetical protein